MNVLKLEVLKWLEVLMSIQMSLGSLPSFAEANYAFIY